MKYHCTWCDYIYDEIKWDIDLNIEPQTFYENLPNDFFCPFCETHKDDFIALEENISYPINIDNLTNFEAEHFPILKLDWDNLSYEIWQIEHPNQEEHFIYKVWLYDDSWDEIDYHKFKTWEHPHWKFDLEYLDIFEIRVYCSRDWIFSTQKIQK